MIPDDEPWWMVRQQPAPVTLGTGTWQAAAMYPSPDRRTPANQLADADEIEEPTDFRPFGYEW